MTDATIGRAKAIRVMVAVPNQLVRRGIADLLSSIDRAVVVAVVPSAAEVGERFAGIAPDVLLVDAEIAETVCGVVGEYRPGCRILVLGRRRHLGVRVLRQAHLACGYFAGCDPEADARAALTTVVHCHLPWPGSGAACASCTLRRSLRLPELPLSEREYDIFLRIGHGQGASHMAHELGISVKTVEFHRESIKRKLRIDSAHALLRAALAWQVGDYSAR